MNSCVWKKRVQPLIYFSFIAFQDMYHVVQILDSIKEARRYSYDECKSLHRISDTIWNLIYNDCTAEQKTYVDNIRSYFSNVDMDYPAFDPDETQTVSMDEKNEEHSVEEEINETQSTSDNEILEQVPVTQNTSKYSLDRKSKFWKVWCSMIVFIRFVGLL